jgi:peptide methionine sulfoxide reductase MsrB
VTLLNHSQSETQEHGWPSFRTPEVISENVITSSDGTTLMSACGTKLGTLEPDADGTPRYCMDLVCIAGSGL